MIEWIKNCFSSIEFFILCCLIFGYFIKNRNNTIKNRKIHIYKMIANRFIHINDIAYKTHVDYMEIKKLINEIPQYFTLTNKIVDAINDFSRSVSKPLNSETIYNMSKNYDNLILVLDRYTIFVPYGWLFNLNEFNYHNQLNKIKPYIPNVVFNYEEYQFKSLESISQNNMISKLEETDKIFILDLILNKQHLIKYLPEFFKSKEPK